MSVCGRARHHRDARDVTEGLRSRHSSSWQPSYETPYYTTHHITASSLGGSLRADSPSLLLHFPANKCTSHVVGYMGGRARGRCLVPPAAMITFERLSQETPWESSFLVLVNKLTFSCQDASPQARKCYLKAEKRVGEGSTQRYTICCGREEVRGSLFHVPLELRRRATNHPPLLSQPKGVPPLSFSLFTTDRFPPITAAAPHW